MYKVILTFSRSLTHHHLLNLPLPLITKDILQIRIHEEEISGEARDLFAIAAEFEFLAGLVHLKSDEEVAVVDVAEAKPYRVKFNDHVYKLI